jgi:hypothetical protein
MVGRCQVGAEFDDFAEDHNAGGKGFPPDDLANAEQRAFPDLLLGLTGPADNRYGHVATAAVLLQPPDNIVQVATTHEHHQGVESGQGGPVQQVRIMGTDDTKAVAPHRIRQGNARQQWGSQGGGNAGYHFKGAVCLPQGLDLGGCAAKNKRISAFESDHPLSLATQVHQKLINLSLGRAGPAPPFAHVKNLTGRRQPLQ